MGGGPRRGHLATEAARKDRLDPMLVDDGHVPDGADRGVGSLEATEPALTLAGEGAMVVVADRSGAGVRARRPDRRGSVVRSKHHDLVHRSGVGGYDRFETGHSQRHSELPPNSPRGPV